jgi:hypothetical protein
VAQEPPDVTWLEPELADGAVPELSPLELEPLELFELADFELALPEPEDFELELPADVELDEC